MHDPLVVAHEIHLPIPRLAWKVWDGGPRWQLKRRRRTNEENLGQPVYAWWRPKGYEVHAFGRVVRMRLLITIWHREPGGHDAFEVCKRGTNWRWHVRHWQIQVPPLQHLRRRLLTRCAWCGGRERRRDAINCSMHWDAPRGRWWRGEPDLFHHDCSGVAQAHRTCICAEPRCEIPAWTVEMHTKDPQQWPLRRPDYGKCLECGAFRRSGGHEPSAVAALAVSKQVPDGKRPTREQKAQIRAAWDVYQTEQAAVRAAERVIEDVAR